MVMYQGLLTKGQQRGDLCVITNLKLVRFSHLNATAISSSARK